MTDDSNENFDGVPANGLGAERARRRCKPISYVEIAKIERGGLEGRSERKMEVYKEERVRELLTRALRLIDDGLLEKKEIGVQPPNGGAERQTPRRYVEFDGRPTKRRRAGTVAVAAGPGGEFVGGDAEGCLVGKEKRVFISFWDISVENFEALKLIEAKVRIERMRESGEDWMLPAIYAIALSGVTAAAELLSVEEEDVYNFKQKYCVPIYAGYKSDGVKRLIGIVERNELEDHILTLAVAERLKLLWEEISVEKDDENKSLRGANFEKLLEKWVEFGQAGFCSDADNFDKLMEQTKKALKK